MKRIDYFWPRTAVHGTGVIFATQVVAELVATRKPDFYWVLPATGAAFTVAIIFAIGSIVWNSKQGGANG